MSTNRFSSDCPNITHVDTAVAQKLSTVSAGRVALVRAAATNPDNKEELHDILDREFPIDKFDALLDKKTLSDDDQESLEEIGNYISSFIGHEEAVKRIAEFVSGSGAIENESEYKMYSLFCSKFPNFNLHREIILQLFSGASALITTRIRKYDAIDDIQKAINYHNEVEGVPEFFSSLRKSLSTHFAKALGNGTLSQEQIEVLSTLTDPNDDSGWKAAVYALKNLMLDAHKIKIGNAEDFVALIDDIEDLNVIEDPEAEVESAEEQGAEHWQLKAGTIKSFNSLTKEVRAALYSLSDGNIGILGFPNIVDTLKMHQTLTDKRHKFHCQNSEDFMNMLKELFTSHKNEAGKETLTSGELWAFQLYHKLLRNPTLRTQFFNCYKRGHTGYVSHTIDRSNGKNTFYRHTESLDAETLLSCYIAKVYDIESPDTCIFDNTGTFKNDRKRYFTTIIGEAYLNKNRVEVDGKFIPQYVEEYGFVDFIDIFPNEQGPKVASTDEERLEKRLRFINIVNEALNLHMSEGDKDKLLEDAQLWAQFSKDLYNFVNALSNVDGSNKTITWFLQNSYANTKLFQNIAKDVIHYTDKYSSTSPTEGAYRYNKSTYVTSTISNSLSDKLDLLGRAASKGSAALREFLEKEYFTCDIYATKEGDSYIIHNPWLKLMYEATDADLNNGNSFINKFINEVVRGLGTKDKPFENFSEKDNHTFTLVEYFNALVASNGTMGVTPLFVTGDSNSNRYLQTPIYSIDECYDMLTNMAIGEYRRIQLFKSFIEMCGKEHYSVPFQMTENQNKFTLFPSLNNYFSELNSIQETIERLQDELFKLETEDPENSIKKDALTAQLEEAKLQQRARFKDLVSKDLFLKYKEWANDLVKKGLAQHLGLASESSFVLSTSIGLSAPKEFLQKLQDPSMLRQFYLNYKLNMMSQFQFLTVDPGFYAGTEDLQKRFKELIAAGNGLDLTAIDESTGLPVDDNADFPQHQKVKYVQDIKVNVLTKNGKDTKLAKVLKFLGIYDKVAGLYEKASLTDGQAYRSFTSYRKILIMRGQWDYNTHEPIYRIIMKARKEHRPLTKLEFATIERYNVVFQPLKPFYYDFEKIKTEDGREVFLPVQHKYSEYPIIPELLPEGSRLAELGKAMEEDRTDNEGNNEGYTDLICFTTCVKVGEWGSVDVTNCNSKEDYLASLKGAKAHQLHLRGYREQMPVPPHFDSARARGTQVTKLGLTSMKDSDTPKKYPFLQKFADGIIKIAKGDDIDVSEGLSGNNMVKLYNALGMVGYLKSVLKLSNQFSSLPSISQALCSIRASDPRGTKDSLNSFGLSEIDGELNLSPAEGINATDNMASLLSKFRGNVIKQRMNGGSAVQVSAYGFEDVLDMHYELDAEGNPTNVLATECATAFDFSFAIETPRGKQQVQLSYVDYIDYRTGKPLGIDGKPLADDEEPAEPVIDKTTGKYVPGKEYYGWNTKLGKAFPGIMERIAYRIPTEKLYSVLSLRSKRFFPKTAGATIMVPTQFTVIAGFDFDIDKLYFFTKEFVFNYKDKVNLQDINRNYWIWTKWYTETELGRRMHPYLIKEREKKDSASPIDIEYYSQALDAMAAAGEDISEYPPTSAEVFSDFISTTEFVEGCLELVSEYDPSKTVYANTQAQTNNLLIEFYLNRLADPDTLKERLTPGGYYNFKNAKPIMQAINYATRDQLLTIEGYEDIEKLCYDTSTGTREEKKDRPKPSYDATEPATQAHYQTYNALYDKLIGIAANQSTNMRLTSLLESLVLTEPLLVGSMLEAYKSDSNVGTNVKERFMNNQDTELNTTETLSAAVDAVKDALLEYFGIDDNNFNMVCLLAKIGASPTDIGLLLNQPVVKIANNKIKESLYYKSYAEALSEALEEIMTPDVYAQRYKEVNQLSQSISTGSKKRDTYLTLDALARNFNPKYTQDAKGVYTDSHGFFKSQMAVVSLLLEVNRGASELSDEVGVSKTTSSNSIQSQLGEIQVAEQKAQEFYLKFGTDGSMFRYVVNAEHSEIERLINPYYVLSDPEEFIKLFSNTPYGMEQAAFTSVIYFLDNVIAKVFPYRSEAFKLASKTLGFLTKKKVLNADIFNTFNKDFMLACLERICPAFSNTLSNTVKIHIGPSSNEIVDTKIHPRVYYTALFPQIFDIIFQENQKAVKAGKNVLDYSKIPILTAIHKETQKFYKGSKVEVLKMNSLGSYVGYQKDALISSWAYMAGSDDRILQDLAVQLFMYSYYNAGFNYRTTSVMSLTPTSLKTNLGSNDGISYRDFFIRMMNLSVDYKENSIISEGAASFPIKNILKKIILNHPEFYQFTKVATGSLKSALLELKEANPESQDITISLGENSPTGLNKLGVERILNSKGELIACKWPPCIKLGQDVYMCDADISLNNNPYFNYVEMVEGSTPTMTYYKMDLPASNVDYSDPTRFGERAKEFEIAGYDRSIITAFEKVLKGLYQNVETSPSEGIPDGNTFDGGDSIEDPIQQICSYIQLVGSQLNKQKDKINEGLSYYQESFEIVANTIAAIYNSVVENHFNDALIKIHDLNKVLRKSLSSSDISGYLTNAFNQLESLIEAAIKGTLIEEYKGNTSTKNAAEVFTEQVANLEDDFMAVVPQEAWLDGESIQSAMVKYSDIMNQLIAHGALYEALVFSGESRRMLDIPRLTMQDITKAMNDDYLSQHPELKDKISNFIYGFNLIVSSLEEAIQKNSSNANISKDVFTQAVNDGIAQYEANHGCLLC